MTIPVTPIDHFKSTAAIGPVISESVDISLEASWKQMAGKFIVVDGPDGAGKTTQLSILANYIRALGLTVTTARDPGGTLIGEGIRDLLLHLPVGPSRPSTSCELLLFMASRAQLVAEMIAPAMERGDVVLCDRFIWSTLAYQAANGSDINDILAVARIAIRKYWPDLTVILDVPIELGVSRIAAARGQKCDAIEERSLAYRRRVRELYLEMPSHFDSPIVVLDASRSVSEVQASLRAALLSAEFV